MEACKKIRNGAICPDSVQKNSNQCSPFQLTKTDSKEFCLFDSYVEENLNIGGADLFVFKLLGVHEQGKLIDLTGNGTPISSGTSIEFSADNAFITTDCYWKSLESGINITENSFIGYDFGEIKLDNARLHYGIPTSIRHNISTIKIKQGDNSINRVIKARIERSEDGIKWFGAALIDLPNDNNLNTIHFKHTVTSRYWRIRPITFNGGDSDHWVVKAIELIDYDLTSIDDIQDSVFQENRDRDYASESILLKGQYDLLDTQSELTKFGIELPSQTFYFQISFSACVRKLGRPILIGDIIELPSETQYDFNMVPIKKFLEVTDIAWSVEGYTPGYTPTLLRVIANPMMAIQETMDLFDELSPNETDETGLTKYGLVDITGEGNSNNGPQFQDYHNDSEDVEALAMEDLPESGTDIANLTEFTAQQIKNANDQGLHTLSNISVVPKRIYVEDAMPSNGIEYTEGDVLPTNPKDGDYHRLTYSAIDIDIPARLFRYSLVKGRWVFLESDKRNAWNNSKPQMEEYYKSRNNPTSNSKVK